MARRGPKTKPTKLKLLDGDTGHRPLPKNEPEAPAGDMPLAPEYLSDEAKIEWARTAPGVYAMGLLTDVDVAAFAAYCDAVGRWVMVQRQLREPDRSAYVIVTKTGRVMINPLHSISKAAALDMVRYAAEFGLTPSARSRAGADRSKLAPTKRKFKGLIGIDGGKRT